MKSRALILGAAVCLMLGAAAGRAKTTKTVQVDCTNGDSINAALQDKADELIVEITGMCQEDVEVRRDNVTLLGVGPNQNGIEAVDGVFGRYALHVRDAYKVVIESLWVTNAGVGLRTDSAKGVEVRDCLLSGNENGAEIYGASDVQIFDSSLSDNGSVTERRGFGLWVRDSRARCTRCEIRDNGRWGVFTDQSGDTRLEESEISAWRGIGGWPASVTIGINSEVTATHWALFSLEADVSWQNGEISGSILASYRGIVDLYGATQTSQSRFGNYIAEGGILVAQGWNGEPTTLVGQTYLDNLSSGIFYGTGTSDGVTLDDLVCDGGSEAVCHGTVIKASSNCGLCP